MNKWLSILAVLGLGVAAASAQLPTYEEISPDIGISVQLSAPGVGDYDLYDYGFGAELQFRDIVSAPWGYLLAIGYSEWTTDENAKKPGSNLYDFDGNLEVIPFGGSVLYQVYNEDSVSVTLDLGLRYLSNGSKITARNSDSSSSERYDVDIDDSIIYRFGVGADYVINPDVIWSAGVGYQGDLKEGDMSTELGPARDNVMEAFVFETALRLPF